jgi:hypothetical protein
MSKINENDPANLNPTQFKVVKTKSIPNVDSARLTDSISRLHDQVHTVEGLRQWDLPRRSLIDYGMKTMAIKSELDKRGVPSPVEGCRWCS